MQGKKVSDLFPESIIKMRLELCWCTIFHVLRLLRVLPRCRYGFCSLHAERLHFFVQWKKEIDDKVTLPNNKALPVVLIGNKSDLVTSDIDRAALDGYCQANGFIAWYVSWWPSFCSCPLLLNVCFCFRFHSKIGLTHQQNLTQISG